MLLKELLRNLSVRTLAGPVDREVTGLTCDVRRVAPGMIYVALPGPVTDGHDFINAAIDRGAAAILCERNGFCSARATKIKVPDVREALAHIAARFHGQPSRKLRVIGITGTRGRTTVAFLVQHLLETSGVSCGLLGSVRNEIGERELPVTRTAPEALEVQQLLASMVRAECTACVMELSSHAIDQKRVAHVQFAVGIFTNLTADHLDDQGTMENCFTAKQRLFQQLNQSGNRGTAVINIDDPYGRRLAETACPEVHLSYGVRRSARLRAVDLVLGPDGSRFTVEHGDESRTLWIPLVGRQNVYNALAAIGAALALQLSWEVIATGLAKAPVVPGRLERIEASQPFNVFVDHAQTGAALAEALETLREITPGRLLVLFGCRSDHNAVQRAAMGRAAAGGADFSVLTSDNPRKESPALIASGVEAGYRSVRPDSLSVELNRRRAIERVLREAGPGDTVLIAGKGHETYQELEHTIVPFDDRVVARDFLEFFALAPAA